MPGILEISTYHGNETQRLSFTHSLIALCLIRSFGAKFRSIASTLSLKFSCGFSVMLLYSICGK